MPKTVNRVKLLWGKSYTSVNLGPRGLSAAAARAGLYAGHVARGELVLGPERLQPPDVAATMKRKNNKPVKATELPEAKPKPSEPSCEMCRCHKNHFTCESCQRTFSTKTNLTKHLLEICNGWNIHMNKEKPKKAVEKEFLCPQCTKSFSLKTSLQNHMSVHSATKPYKCEHCGKRFKKKGTLQVHERTHTGEKPFKCRICSKHFRQQTSRNNHMLLHSGRKPQICRICNKRFTQVSNLVQHVQKCHPNEMYKEVTNSVTKNPQPKSVKLLFF